MNIRESLDRLRFGFGFGERQQTVLQTEATECGLACLCMIANFHGDAIDLASLRRRFPASLKGATLDELIRVAERLQLGTRPLKLELAELKQLRLPSVLHWNFNHFVVLMRVDAAGATIHDPAAGPRRLSWNELSRAFTGVALELWPNPEFRPQQPKPRLRLRELMGRVTGLRRSLAQILVLALVLEVFALLGPLLTQLVIDDVIVSADRDLLSTLAVGFALLLLLQQAISLVRTWAIMYLGTTLSLQWTANVFSHLVRLPMAYFEKRHLGDIVSRFGAVDSIQHTLTTSFLAAILDGLMALSTLVMMFLYSTTLGWIAVTAMLLYGASRWLWYAPLRSATEQQIVQAARQQTHFLETVRGIKAIKLFGRLDERRASWLSLVVAQVNVGLRTQKMSMLYGQINGLLFGFEGIAVIWVGARLVLTGHFSVGVFMAFLSYKSQFEGRVSSLIDKYFELRMLQLQGERLADIVLTQPEPLETVGGAPDSASLPGCVELKDVRFRYSEQDPYVLDGLSLSIAAGESVAIVGASGCGKTTLINLMLGVFEPTAGEVRIGGVTLRRLGLAGLRNMIGTVMQDDVLFAGSIEDNISFFAPTVDREWMRQCAQMAAIDADIQLMPMGYASLVGDMGTVLSGGQKQRVLLARALYKRPQILFLDEATSHLDLKCEAQINAVLRAQSMTRIIVAHRPETIAAANRVLVLTGGRVQWDRAFGSAETAPASSVRAAP